MEFKEALKVLGIEEYGERIFKSNSHVVGELKHRLVALKQRITLVNQMTTSDLFR